jgi:type I restriction enzyme S subunit
MSIVESLSLASQSAWPIDRIKDHALKIGSGVTPSGGAAGYLDAGVPLLRSQNVHFDGLRLDDVAYIADETHKEMSGTKLQARDVLLNITGASIGRCTYVPEGFGEGNVNQHVCIIRTTPRLEHRFLTYCLSAPWGQDQVFSSFTGASRQGLGQRDLGAIQVPIPSLPEQQRITAYLDRSCAVIDAAVTAKNRQLETLAAIQESIIETAVTRGLNERANLRVIDRDWIGSIPENWSAVSIKRVISRLDYGISVSSEPEGKYPVLKMGNIQNGEIVFSKIEFVDEVADELLLEHNDLLYNRTNSPDQVGKAALFLGTKNDTVTFASYLVRLRVNHRVIPEFLNFAVNCSGFLAFARRLAIPSVQQSNLNSTRYGRLYIPLPPVNEQSAICEHLNTKVGEMKRVIATIENQIATLTAYRKSLIHECVTGKYRVTEADINRIKKHV